MTMTTIETSTRIRAYSTIPWPSWRVDRPRSFQIRFDIFSISPPFSLMGNHLCKRFGGAVLALGTGRRFDGRRMLLAAGLLRNGLTARSWNKGRGRGLIACLHKMHPTVDNSLFPTDPKERIRAIRDIG